MACCVFALLIISQLLLPFRKLRTFLFGEAPEKPNTVAVWQLHADSVSPPSKSRNLSVVVCSVVVLEGLVFFAAIFGVSASFFSGSSAQASSSAEALLLADIHTSICGIF